jgi:hypothetical protein
MLSTVYRQSSVRDAQRDAIDSENRYYWRRDLQRLDAEVLRDSVLALAGQLKTDLYGPPIPLQEDDAGQVRIDPSQPRRSLYAKARRTQPVAMLQAFDAPVMGINCDIRPASTVATQSLMMMNNEFLLDQADKLAKRIAERTAAQVVADPTAVDDPLSNWKLPSAPAKRWRFGTGKYNRETGRLESFAEFANFSEGRSLPGNQIPDPATGYAFLTATGGHPGNASYPAIRRWIAPSAGTVEISGTLSHGSENGDGVIGRISSKHGVAGSWNIKAGSVGTPATSLAVEADDAIDLVLECGEHETSDSFSWTVKVTFIPSDPSASPSVFDSTIGFQLQQEDYSSIGRQIVVAWDTILHRRPSDNELGALGRFVQTQLELLYRQPERLSGGNSATRQVLVNVCQMLLSSNEFLYID